MPQIIKKPDNQHKEDDEDNEEGKKAFGTKYDDERRQCNMIY